MKHIVQNLIITALAFTLVSCGGDDEEEVVEPTIPPEEYYKQNPEFFTFSSPEELPDDLTWVDGMEEPELGSPEAKKGGTFHYYVSDFPRTIRLVGPDASAGFRPFLLDDNGGPGGMALTIRHPDTLNQFPCLAKEWAVASDKKTVYYKLDPEARYSDGVPVKADDYLFMFYFMQSKHLKAPWYNDYYATKFSNITKFDDHTISITFSEAKPDIVYRTGSIRPVPRHFYKDFDHDYVKKYNFKFEPTTGPYELLEENLQKGRSITMTKVKDWWAKDKKYFRNRYNPDKIHLQVLRDPDKAFEVFLAGEIDFSGLTLPEYWHKKLPDDTEEVEKGYIEKTWFYNIAPRYTYGLRLNTARAPLNDLNVRLGIQHACNWQKVIDTVFYGDYTRMETCADGYGPASHPTLKARRFDPAKAEEYFSKAGFNQRGPDGILMNSDGNRLSITLTTGYKHHRNSLNMLKEEAKKGGLELNLEIIDFAAAIKKMHQKKHQISFSALSVSVELYPRFWETYHSYHAYEDPFGPNKKIKVNTNNTTSTADKELDTLIDEYRAMTNYEDINKRSQELIEWIHDSAVFAPAWKAPFYRLGKWRWVRYPDFFDHRSARDPIEMHVFWIDEDMKQETKDAMSSGKTFPKVIKIYDQHKVVE